MQEIPIEALENQNFQTIFKGNTYDCSITHNRAYGYYQFSCSLNGESVIANRKMTFDRNILIEAFGLGTRLGLYNVENVEDLDYTNFGAGIKLIYEE